MYEDEYGAEPAINYYRDEADRTSGLKYRLDGEDVIERAVDTLRGGVKSKTDGHKKYFDEYKCMNELGIQRARMILEAGVNKINHLTKYSDKEMILRQIRSIIKAWVFEVTLNAKAWAPEARMLDNKLYNPFFHKVRNKRLIIQVVENSLLQSMLRGSQGFEAELTSKQFSVTEVNDNRQQPRSGQRFGSWIFGRRGNEYG